MGEINKLTTVILTLVFIGIILGVGFLVLQEFKNSIDDDYSNSYHRINDESVTQAELTAGGTTGIYLDKNSTNVDCFNSGTIKGTVLSVVNSTDKILITSGNWSYDSTTGLFRNITNTFPNATWYVNYTYYGDGDSCDALTDTITAAKEIPGWLTIIVIIVIVGVLIFLVLNTPGIGGKNKGEIAEI